MNKNHSPKQQDSQKKDMQTPTKQWSDNAAENSAEDLVADRAGSSDEDMDANRSDRK